MDDDDIALRSLDSVESDDFDTDSWEESVPMSQAGSGAKIAFDSGCLYVIGAGARNAQKVSLFLRSAERFDPVTGRLFPT